MVMATSSPVRLVPAEKVSMITLVKMTESATDTAVALPAIRLIRRHDFIGSSVFSPVIY